jgi:CRP/FNR family transcriptional regulator, cyclic AMP receptor protein
VDYEVLDSLPAEDRAALLGQCPVRSFRSGDIIVAEGEPGDDFYLIEAGRVALRVTTPAGEVSTLSVLSAGQSFGEMALVARRRRTATAVALEPVTAKVMSRRLFESLRLKYSGVDRILVDILASRVDRLSQQLAEALYLPVDVRLARRLLALTEVYRTAVGPVVLPLTQEDIAGIVGASRPTVNQILNRLADANAVELRRGRVTVLDERALHTLATNA